MDWSKWGFDPTGEFDAGSGDERIAVLHELHVLSPALNLACDVVRIFRGLFPWHRSFLKVAHACSYVLTICSYSKHIGIRLFYKHWLSAFTSASGYDRIKQTSLCILCNTAQCPNDL